MKKGRTTARDKTVPWDKAVHKAYAKGRSRVWIREKEINRPASPNLRKIKSPDQELYELERRMEFNSMVQDKHDWDYFYKRRKRLIKRMRGEDARYKTVGIKVGGLTEEEWESQQINQTAIDIYQILNPEGEMNARRKKRKD